MDVVSQDTIKVFFRNSLLCGEDGELLRQAQSAHSIFAFGTSCTIHSFYPTVNGIGYMPSGCMGQNRKEGRREGGWMIEWTDGQRSEVHCLILSLHSASEGRKIFPKEHFVSTVIELKIGTGAVEKLTGH